jgi:CDP-2,3-bis-(O-geranylgeranyl)-sn-glycerol synthase
MDPLAVVVVGIWAMLPAYVPNNVAVVAGGGAPIDGGRTWRGDRILGDGKTWRGTAVGVTTGAGLALLLNAARPFAVGATGVEVPSFPLRVVVALPLGALLGDILASFLKRRTGRQRGAAFPGVDQMDFVVVSLALTAAVAPGWFLETFWPWVLGVVVVVTPALHLLANWFAFQLGLKDEPY